MHAMTHYLEQGEAKHYTQALKTFCMHNKPKTYHIKKLERHIDEIKILMHLGYGSSKIHAFLLQNGVQVSRSTVYRRMDYIRQKQKG